jgi:Family of unknown function (DUF6325)
MPATSPPVGPVEWVALTFPGSTLDPAVVSPIADLVGAGSVRVLDAAVVHKDADGAVTGAELEDEGVQVTAAFDAVDGEILELLSDADLLAVAERLEDDSTTLVLVWENLWATAFAEAVRRAGGTVLAHDRVPRTDVERAVRASTPEGTPA